MAGVKIKTFLVLTVKTHGVSEEELFAFELSRIRLRSAVSFTSQPLYPGKTATEMHWIWGS
jgi:hypothetical protein